jgi:hypothetical protein
MLNKLTKTACFFVISIFVTIPVLAQKDNKTISNAASLYLISAKAGGVNFVTGAVSAERGTGKKDFLHKGDNIEVGDKVSTGIDGKAEILLNPGSYIRLAGNSEFEFLSTSLDDLQIKVNRGSAMFEVIADEDFTITVKTPDSRFYLITAGVFRVDATENGGGRISVWKGKAQVGDMNATVVKGGKTASFENGQVAVGKFDRDDKGEFENWSRDRAKEIAQINARLQQRQMNRALMNSFGNNAWGGTGYGLWVQDPWSRSFCFLPFGYGWSSPYGFGYSQSIWNYTLPPQMTTTIYQNQTLNNANNNNSQPAMNPPPSIYPSGNPAGNPGGNMGTVPVNNSPAPIRAENPNSRPNIVERKERPIDN